MKLKITCIPGDGIGPEIIAVAKTVLAKIAALYGHELDFTDILMGGASIDVHGIPLTEEALETAKQADAVLMGSIGGDVNTSPWYRLEPHLRPEAGLLTLRKELKLFANLRPAFLYEELKSACPLKEEIAANGFDMIVVRELTGGLYFGERQSVIENGIRKATDTLNYDETEIKRVAIKALETAMKRRKNLISVDKANVLASSRLWRQVVGEVAAGYPEVALSHMLVDNCAMQLVKNPAQFDVVLTENMFGDILSDEASMITGSIGMLPSASLNETKFGLYEPSHGSAPDIAGQDLANPLATILSAALMLRYSFDLEKEATAIEAAVQQALSSGYRTADIYAAGATKVGCREMGELVVKEIK
jgi:3-isopropylmalate dehydrogenase